MTSSEDLNIKVSNKDESEREELARDDQGRAVARRQITRLMGSSDIPVYVLDDQDVIVYVNEAMVNLTGLSADDLIGLDCSMLVSTHNPPNPPTAAQDTKAVQKSDTSHTKKHWTHQLTPPVVWDRKSLHVDAWSEGRCRVLLPLDSATTEIKSNAIKSTVLVFLTDTALAAVANQLSFSNWQLMNALESPAIPVDDFSIESAKDGEVWFAAGNSLIATALRQQLRVACQSTVSTLIVGPACKCREGIAEWIYRNRSTYQSEQSKHLSSMAPEVPRGELTSYQARSRGFPKQSLVRIDCNLLDATLLDELFEVIDSSVNNSEEFVTVFLSRLDEIPEELVLLLDRYLGTHGIKGNSNITVIASSSIELRNLAERNATWDRLRLRIEQIQVTLPSISSRLEDIEAVLTSWLRFEDTLTAKQMGQVKQAGAPNFSFSTDALDALCAYGWPGSYEEFSQVLRQARASAINRQIELADLPQSIRTALSYWSTEKSVEALDLDKLLEDVERKLILEALETSKGNRSSAAKLLNISRARIIRRLQQWGMIEESPDKKSLDTEPELDLPKFEEID